MVLQKVVGCICVRLQFFSYSSYNYHFLFPEQMAPYHNFLKLRHHCSIAYCYRTKDILCNYMSISFWFSKTMKLTWTCFCGLKILNLHYLHVPWFLLIFIRCKEDEIHTVLHEVPQTQGKIQPSLLCQETQY